MRARTGAPLFAQICRVSYALDSTFFIAPFSVLAGCINSHILKIGYLEKRDTLKRGYLEKEVRLKLSLIYLLYWVLER